MANYTESYNVVILGARESFTVSGQMKIKCGTMLVRNKNKEWVSLRINQMGYSS